MAQTTGSPQIRARAPAGATGIARYHSIAPYRGSPHFSCISGGWQSPRRPNFRDASRLREATTWPAGIGKPFDVRLKVHDTLLGRLRWLRAAIDFRRRVEAIPDDRIHDVILRDDNHVEQNGRHIGFSVVDLAQSEDWFAARH